MARYYATIAGLPNIGVEDRKLPISIEQFIDDLSEVLTSRDAELLRRLRLEEAHRSVLDTLHLLDEGQTPELQEDDEENSPLLIDLRQVVEMVQMLKQREERLRKNSLPSYLRTYLTERYPSEEEIEARKEAEDERDPDDPQPSVRLLELEEDRLAAYYYDFLLHSSNKFIRRWAELNLNIRNVLTAFTCRQLGWNRAGYIVGDNEIAQQLRSSQARDFGIDEELLVYMPRLVAIAEEQDIARRERMIDVLRWEWLDEQTFFRPFDVEVLLAYYLQLSIVERWLSLNEKTGEETFRRIVQELKQQSTDSLNEFRRNQKK